MLYRVLESLRRLKSGERIPAGTISSLKGVSATSIKLLLAKKRIAKVKAPPLSILPGWKERAPGYAEQGIEDVSDLADAEGVPVEDVEEAMQWLEPGVVVTIRDSAVTTCEVTAALAPDEGDDNGKLGS